MKRYSTKNSCGSMNIGKRSECIFSIHEIIDTTEKPAAKTFISLTDGCSSFHKAEPSLKLQE